MTGKAPKRGPEQPQPWMKLACLPETREALLRSAACIKILEERGESLDGIHPADIEMSHRIYRGEVVLEAVEPAD